MKKCLALVVAVLAVVPLPAAPAWASCIAPLPVEEAIAQAKVAFVGTVTGLQGGDPRRAVVRVEEVRKGGPLPDEVLVIGTPGDGAAVTSVDRTFTIGARYVFVPYDDASPFHDNACSSTTRLDATDAPLVPVVPVRDGTPTKPAGGSGGPAPLLLWIGGAVLVAAVGALALGRRGSRSGS